MRTLVAGFVGSYVVRALLDAGREVLVLDVRDFAPEGRFAKRHDPLFHDVDGR